MLSGDRVALSNISLEQCDELIFTLIIVKKNYNREEYCKWLTTIFAYHIWAKLLHFIDFVLSHHIYTYIYIYILRYIYIYISCRISWWVKEVFVWFVKMLRKLSCFVLAIIFVCVEIVRPMLRLWEDVRFVKQPSLRVWLTSEKWTKSFMYSDHSYQTLALSLTRWWFMIMTVFQMMIVQMDGWHIHSIDHHHHERRRRTRRVIIIDNQYP